MSGPWPATGSTLSASGDRRVDGACDRFEGACRGGGRPRIEDYLAELPEPERPALLRELLRIELAYRRAAGEAPAADDYRPRFPDQAATIAAAFAAAAACSPADAATEPGDDLVNESVADFALAELTVRDPTDAPAGYPARGGPRFRVLRGHARGNLGEVLVAHDEELNREVALKRIRAERDDPRGRSRFVLEAEITGGLEHPGIVPVYGRGHGDDGRPYYAMRLIQGQSLRQAIDRLHGDDRPARDPNGWILDLRRLLGRFVAVCNAVAYAHSKGVLHRDLKPSNIMLGDYGETLVVDWGLAKRLDRPDPAAPPALPPRGDPEETATWMGTILGTPAYMSPEQAWGRIDWLAPASDVYGLGATLYCLLTGRAPCAETDVEDAVRAARRGDFPAPSELNPHVPPALEAICLKAMSLWPVDRHHSARDLADELERWLADEPILAYREAVTVYDRLVQAQPERPNYRDGRARSRTHLGIALQVLGRYPEAEAALRDAIADYQVLVDAHPHVTSYREGLAAGYSNLGRILMALGGADQEAAKAAYRAAFAEYERLVKAAPQALDYRTNLGNLLVTLGRTGDLVQQTLGRPGAAGPGAVVDTVDLRPAPTPAAGPAPVVGPDEGEDQFGFRYQILRLHARGGLGVLWIVHDRELHRDVALKALRPDQADHPEARRWFLKEGQIAAQLEHSHIVPVYDLGRTMGGRPFYTMKFVPGMTLRTWVEVSRQRAGALDLEDLRRMLEALLRVCDAIGYAHARGVIHRDLKPSNVLIGGYGEVMVSDWGLARLVDRGGDAAAGPGPVTDSSDAGTTLFGTVLGTPAYMAPEQARGGRDGVDERTDVYGLGAILFEVLTGRPPHLRRGESVAETIQGILTGPTPRARDVDPAVPGPLDAICARAMAREPSGRYSDPAALAADLRRWLVEPAPRGRWLARRPR